MAVAVKIHPTVNMINLDSDFHSIFSEKGKFRPSHSNWELFHELEELFISTRQLLLDNEHNHVWQQLKGFFEQDILLREQIAKELMPSSDTDYNPLNSQIDFLIEYQGMYNNFRLRLLVDIANLLVDKYDRAIYNYPIDLQKGGKLAHEAQLLYSYYFSYIQDFYTEEQGFQYQIYHEAINAFNAVKISGERSVAKMTSKILELESMFEKKGSDLEIKKNFVIKSSKMSDLDKVRILSYKINSKKLENSIFC